jgi:hypothetical protein
VGNGLIFEFFPNKRSRRRRADGKYFLFAKKKVIFGWVFEIEVV